MFTGTKTQKWKNLLQNPFATLCVDDREPPYQSVIVHGKIEEVQIPLNQFVKYLSMRYYGLTESIAFSNLYPDNAKDVVIFKLIPSKIVSDLQKP